MDPVGIVFGVASALSWGSSDFAGGLVSRAIGSLTTATAAQIIGLLALVPIAAFAAESAPDQAEVAWALAAGIGGSIGIASFYRALAVGEMSLVAPLTGAIGAGVPIAVSFLLGEAIGPLQALGIGCALAAVVLVSTGARSGTPSWGALPFVLLAGLGFATFYVTMDQATSASGHIWLPLLLARIISSVVLVALTLAVRGPSSRPTLGRLPVLLFVGVADLGGSGFFMLANASGPLSLAVVLSSLYPVATAMLAWLLLHERLARHQVAGAALAIVGIVLIAS